jgi:glycerate kinase
MRVLVCPDKFAGTLSAVAAADAIAEGWRSAAPADEVTTRPLADGGPGFLEVLAAAMRRAGSHHYRVPVAAVDPLGRPAAAEVLVSGDTAYVESAQACGLHLLAEAERDPRRTTSYGLGVLIAVAAETGARRVVVGLGGSATNDGGAGLLAALGAAPADAAGLVLPYGGAALVEVAGLSGPPVLRPVELVAATDVDNPLTGPAGASAVFGPQKGASEGDVALLDAALGRLARVLEDALVGCPPGLAALPGGGAAGGLGAALLALGGRCESGIGLVWRLCGLDAALADADLVITGEGSFDAQSLRGKVVAGVAGAARERGVPCLVLAGRVSVVEDDAAAAGVTTARALVDLVGPDRAMREPAAALRELAADAARVFS